MEIVEDDGRFVVSIPDLPGCVSYGDTPEEALANLKAIKHLWLKGAFETGQTIVEPTMVEDFSGKFVLRIPRSLHQALDREARKQGVSLNMYIAHLLSERHKLTSLEGVAEQWIAECAASPKVTVLQCKQADSTQWRNQGSAAFWHSHFIGSSGSHRNLGGADASLVDMVSYLAKPPKVYRRVVKQSKLGIYRDL
jgi:predicted RNase H-like HicB family nuclease